MNKFEKQKVALHCLFFEILEHRPSMMVSNPIDCTKGVIYGWRAINYIDDKEEKELINYLYDLWHDYIIKKFPRISEVFDDYKEDNHE